MKSKKYFSLFIFVVLFLNTSYVKAQDKETLKDYFESQEIAELEKLTSIFDSVVQQKTFIKELPLAYKEFLKKLAEIKSPNEASAFYRFDFDVKDKVSPIIFDKIWVFEKSYGYKVKDTIISLNINTNGEYIKYLNSKTKNIIIEKYYEGIMNSGGFSPSMTAWLQHDRHKLDFNDFDNRLIVAIHYLTLNDLK